VAGPLIGAALLAAALPQPFGALLGTGSGAALVGAVVDEQRDGDADDRQRRPRLADCRLDRRRQQTSMNLALGSAFATIGLTVPVVVGFCLVLDIPLDLGLDPKDIALLALTFLVCTIAIGSGGRTSLMLGVVQVVIFAAFLFVAFVP
jgi:hypothetical protein